MSKATSKGQCHLCHGSFAKTVMTRHLQKCLASAAAPPRRPATLKAQKTFYLLVEGRYEPHYWLHLEAPAAASLEQLDRFLRGIWLECCGHLSAFTVGGERYAVSPSRDSFFGDADQSMKKKLYAILSPGLVFEHEYDYGSTTHLKLKVLGEGEQATGSGKIAILARNDPPEIKCESCAQPATKVCSGCIYNDPAWYCDACAEEHECGEEMMLPVVNSPRVGVCGYTG